MELKYLYPYKEMEKYSKSLLECTSWEEIMITPYWSQISEWGGNACDFMKPKPIKERILIKKQVELLKELDMTVYKKDFQKIIDALPKNDEDPMTIAFYPSDTNLEEGVFGLNVWGNVVICFNPLIVNSKKWIPFVFAHEYHHVVLGFYWYYIKKGKETKGTLLEYLINEGQADEFAKSLYPNYEPSWHRWVSKENEHNVWEILKNALYDTGSIKQLEKYMFGSKELRIPSGAGYYFGSKIVSSYMKTHPNISFSQLIEVPHQTIFDESLSVFSDK